MTELHIPVVGVVFKRKTWADERTRVTTAFVGVVRRKTCHANTLIADA